MNELKQFFRGFKKGMASFGQSISLLINTILLAFVYLLGVGFTSIVAKIVGKRFLDTKLKKGTYWSDLNLKKKPIEEYYRQF